MSWVGVVLGLGFVLSFGYWCTDFLVIQRAMAAKSMTAARNTPIVAAVRANGGWLHVDGAFGMWAAVPPTRRHLVAGLVRAGHQHRL